jgi:TetR/AcrR family transcriptional repressor of nem operon
LKLVDALAGGFDDGTPDEARRRALVAALTLIGALTVSRIVTDQALSNAILRNAEDSITGSQTTGRKKAKTRG